MAVLNCYQCNGPVADNAAACPHCGAPRLEPASPGKPAHLGACYRCGAPAYAACRDCGNLHCSLHGGKDLAGYPACNQCRSSRLILLLVIFPVLLIIFLILLIVIPRFLGRP